MASRDHGGEPAKDETPGAVALAGEPQASDSAEAIALTSAPDVLSNSLGEYMRVWLRRVRSGESGALPVIIGLIALGAYFQLSESPLSCRRPTSPT